MNGSPRYNPTAHADVCLLLEGTYPYVRGGVSTWVKQLIERMPTLRFSIIFLGANPDDYDEPAYEIADNIVHIEIHYLLDNVVNDNGKPRSSTLLNSIANNLLGKNNKKANQFEVCSHAHAQLKDVESPLEASVIDSFTELLIGEDALTAHDLAHNRHAWEVIREKYHDAPAGLDFNHFFWTVRSMHEPLFTLASIAANAPSADLYHSVSTGYAGYLGAMCQSQTQKPYIISEHGIYTKERELDLAQVDWIPADLDPFRVGLNDNMNYLRSVWIRFFKSLGRMSYSSANQVFTLFNGNRLRQIQDGANPDTLSIIPNGVDVGRYAQVRRADDAPVPPVLGLMGRVVPIKDIKNFIRSMRIVREAIPDAEGWLIGPVDEDPEYTEECRQLIKSLDLEDVVLFKGFQKPDDMFPKLGLNVLTSVSEGQPLVVLEGYAAGIPTVTTDVGSCSELVYGITKEDQAMGPAGEVVPIASPAIFAKAAIRLLSDRQAWDAASAVAIERVENYYDENDMVNTYRDIYESEIALDKSALRKAG